MLTPLNQRAIPLDGELRIWKGETRPIFTGRKDSAEGTLSVHDALRSFSIRSMVATKQTEANRKLLDAIVLGNKSGFVNTRFIL